jgi:hypothetical protein
MVARMTTTPRVARRILVRSLHGLRRQKGSLLLSAGAIAALVGYLFVVSPNAASSHVQVAAAPPDCPDAVMAAIVGRGAAPVQQQAYQCMSPELQQRVFQDGFASNYRTLASAAVSTVSRVGTHDAESGTKLVYYAVDAGDQSVAYVMHVSTDGKVTEIS